MPVNQSDFRTRLPNREQLRHVLGAALGNCEQVPRPLSAYEPLEWLLREPAANGQVRRARRSLYRKLVSDLAREFDRVYQQRINAANGPWTFEEIYEASGRAKRCIRRMRWCAFLHALHLPSASAASGRAYGEMLELVVR